MVQRLPVSKYHKIRPQLVELCLLQTDKQKTIKRTVTLANM